MKIKTHILTLICLIASLATYAQEPVNPSFEGIPGMARIPTQWQPFGQASSPDTQPGAWEVTTKPSHGGSYMSMVCRGFSIYDSYLWESALQHLNEPLYVGDTYHYSIDLAFSKTFKADTIKFDQPAQLRIWGMANTSERELLWESGAVANTDWKTFNFELSPNIPVDYLILEAYYVELPKYCGNILIDNMRYYPEAPELISGLVPESPDSIEVVSPDSVEVVDNNTISHEIPDEIDGREINQEAQFTFRGDHLTITVWDNRTTDGDVISLFMNDKNILNEFTISKERLDVDVKVEEGVDYYLTLYAHNLGTIPPNTVALYISDGLRKKFITLTSDLKACGAVKIKVEHQLVDNIE